MNNKIIKITPQEEEALMSIFQAALTTGNFNVAQNVVYFRKLILETQTIEEKEKLHETNHVAEKINK